MFSRRQCEAIAQPRIFTQTSMLRLENSYLRRALQDTLTREAHNTARAEALLHAIVEFVQAYSNITHLLTSFDDQQFRLARLYLADCYEFLELLARCSTPRFAT